MSLDDAYANGAYIPGAEGFPPRWAEAARAFRETTRCELGVPYGACERQALDLFFPEAEPAGLMVFVHGGYWRAFGREDWSHLAAGALARGWAAALPSYDLCPQVRIAEITRQVAQAVDVAAERVAGPVALTGHSAGGHLVARLACADVPLAVRDRLQAVAPISPLGDLVPLMGTALNDDLRIDAGEAERESPVRHPAPEVPVTVWVGGDERPAFRDQARRLAGAWDCALREVPARHHFDVIEELERPDCPLLESLLSS